MLPAVTATTFQQIKNSLRELYLEDARPWRVGFSGDKSLPHSLRSENVTLLRHGDFFVSKLIVLSAAFCEKTKKSQTLRTSSERLEETASVSRRTGGAGARSRLFTASFLSIPAEQRKKPISVLCTDRRVEILAIADMIEGALRR
jgi:hypothetical protein